jgi:hypothetical protein
MKPGTRTPIVAVRLRPVAYEDLDPVQRAAWDSFWSELVRSVANESYRPQPKAGGSREEPKNQRRRGRAVSMKERYDDSTQEISPSSTMD